MQTIKTGQEVTLRFFPKWADGSVVDLRKQTGAKFTLTNPNSDETPIDDIGYDRLNNQLWVRINSSHTQIDGEYKGLMTCFDDQLQHLTTGIISVFKCESTADIVNPVLLTPAMSVIGTEGSVGDVLVDGVSVVTDGVAYVKVKGEQHSFSQIYTNGTDLQKICSLASGNSAILRYSWYLNGRSYSDEVYYTSTNYPTDGYFYSHFHQDFIESRRSSSIPNCLCIKTKGAAVAPTATLTIEVLFASGTITWYDGDDVVSPSNYDKVCEKIASTIDLSNSTNLTTNESGVIYNDAQVEVTSLEDGKTYTMNASASNGAFTIPSRSDYSGTNIFMYGDGVATLNGKTYSYTSGQTLQLKEGEVVIEEEGKNYYTKEESDYKLAAEASAREYADQQLQSNLDSEATARDYQDGVLQKEIEEATTACEIELEAEDTIEIVLEADDSDVVHTSGNETIGGTKVFTDSTYFGGTSGVPYINKSWSQKLTGDGYQLVTASCVLSSFKQIIPKVLSNLSNTLEANKYYNMWGGGTGEYTLTLPSPIANATIEIEVLCTNGSCKLVTDSGNVIYQGMQMAYIHLISDGYKWYSFKQEYDSATE